MPENRRGHFLSHTVYTTAQDNQSRPTPLITTQMRQTIPWYHAESQTSSAADFNCAIAQASPPRPGSLLKTY